MYQPASAPLPWALSTDQNAWMAQPAPMWTATPTAMYPAYPPAPALVEGIPTYGRYENVYAQPMVPAMAPPMAPMAPMSPMPVPYPMVNPEDFVAVTSANWSNAVMTQSQQDALQKKMTFAQVVIEDQLNSQSLYKTELCRSFEETGNCRYGMKCQFAHGKDELRPVLRHPKYKTEICRTFHSTGTCPYGKRCRFIHQSADEANLNSINVIPWSRNVDQENSDDSDTGTSSSGEDIADIADQFGALEIGASEPGPETKVTEEEEKAKVSSKSKVKVEKSKSKTDSDKKKGNKRRLAFFARLSGDTSSNTQSQ